MKKIPEFKGDFLMNISGTGTGLALLFIFFHDNLSLSPDWLSKIDIFLAFCVVVFFMKFIIAIMQLMEVINSNPGIYSSNFNFSIYRKIVGIILIISMICLGLMLSGMHSPPLISAMVLSFVLVASGTEMLLLAIKSMRS